MTSEQKVDLGPEMPPVRIGGVQLRKWADGDFEIDLQPDCNEGWHGHYFKPHEAKAIRDWLDEAYP